MIRSFPPSTSASGARDRIPPSSGPARTRAYRTGLGCKATSAETADAEAMRACRARTVRTNVNKLDTVVAEGLKYLHKRQTARQPKSAVGTERRVPAQCFRLAAL